MSRWKNLVIVFIVLWLPLQGYGAVAMPFCEHGPAMPDASAAAPAHTNGHADHGGLSHHDHKAGSHADSKISADKPTSLGCSNCGACQLACAPLIVATVTRCATAGSPVYDPLPVASLTSVSPEQLQRPPLPALA